MKPAGAAGLEIFDVEPLAPLTVVDGVSVGGGYGSDLCADPHDPDVLWLLTDRGPNVDAGPDRKLFPLPDFVPQICSFRIRDGLLRLLDTIPLRDRDGVPFTGLPPRGGAAVRRETAIALDGSILPPAANGIDPEGLAVLPDGSFRVAEEYGPSLLHLAPDGRLLEHLHPGDAPGDLPRALLARRPNHGLEALALLADGRTLATVMQGVLDDHVPGAPAHALVVLIDTVTGAQRELLYPLDGDDTFVSGLCACGADALLALEHDGRVPGAAERPSRCKRVYRVAMPARPRAAMPPKAHVAMPPKARVAMPPRRRVAMPAAGARPDSRERELLEKTPLLDLLALGYPHDKPEGIALSGTHSLLIVNDDDFGIRSDGSGRVVEKRLPQLGGQRDRTSLWRIALEAPLIPSD